VLGHSPRSHVLTDTVRGVCGVECGWHELIDQFSYEQAVRWSALGVGRGGSRHVAPQLRDRDVINVVDNLAPLF
jgi:hypothetical protein